MDDKYQSFIDAESSQSTDVVDQAPTGVRDKYQDFIDAESVDTSAPTAAIPDKYQSFIDAEGGQLKKSPTPQTDAVVNQSREAMRPKVAPEIVQGVMDIVRGIPGMLEQLPEAAYQGLKFAAGMPQQQREVALDVLKKVVPEGRQLAQDVNAPIGSREWTRGMIQLGMFATPGLELLKEFGGARIEPGIEAPPISAEARVPTAIEQQPIAGGETYAVEPSYAQMEARAAPLGVEARPGGEEPPAGYSDYALGEAQRAEPGGTVPQPGPAGEAVVPEVQAGAPAITKEQAVQELKSQLGVRDDQAEMLLTSNDPARDIRSIMEQSGVRQSSFETTAEAPTHFEAYEAAVKQAQETVTDVVRRSKPAAAGAPPVQIPISANVAGFEKLYGPGEIRPGETITPEEAWTQAEADRANPNLDPYRLVKAAQSGAMLEPRQMGELIAEHDRLVKVATSLEGRPGYNEAYQTARTFAENVVKPAENVWHRFGQTLQIAAPPDFTSVTGIRTVADRMGRELAANEAAEATRIARENKSAEVVAQSNGERLLSAMDKEYSRGARRPPKTADQLRAQLLDRDPCAL